jgi:thioredoxin reductase (NADPH)
VSKTSAGAFCVESAGRHGSVSITAKYIIIATGIGSMVPNISAGIIGLGELKSDFVQSYCMNLNLYKNKRVIIVGGGDSAVDFAINIAEIASSVALIHRRKEFTCEPLKLKKLHEVAVDVILNHNVVELKETGALRIAIIKDAESEKLRKLTVDHIVFCCGFSARPCQIAGLEELGLRADNFLIDVNFETMETSINNCYAVGDVITYPGKKKNIITCFFEADRCVRAIKNKMVLCSNS